MDEPVLECIEMVVGHQAKVDASVIWLHGLGADGHDFANLLPQLSLNPDLNIRFVFPHAPVRPITLNQGMQMRGWYDIKSIEINNPEEDQAGLEASSMQLRELIERENNQGVRSERIVLAGFSQGGAVALYTMARLGFAIAGVMALSTYLPLPRLLSQQKTEFNIKTPILMVHGREDMIVPYVLAEDSQRILQREGFGNIEWHDYVMGHQVCPQEVALISNWLNTRLSNES